MTLPMFEVLRPKTLAEALRWLTADPNAFPIAGGTNLIVDARAGKLAPETVIDLSSIRSLRVIEVSDEEIRIGACVTIAQLLDDVQIADSAPVLHAAARTFANALIRNRATIGGNLANNAPCADTAPALLVLDAEVELASEGVNRWVKLEDFLVEPFVTAKRKPELVTWVRFPVPPSTSIGRFRKMGLRKISCMAKVDVAVQLNFDEAGTCNDARIALGAACPVAMRVPEAESLLIGQRLDAKRIQAVATTAARAAIPRAGSEYKQQVVSGLVKQLLEEIAEEAGDANA